jgi:hypothetical protein
MARLERIVVLAIAMPFAGLGWPLEAVIYLLAATTAFTVAQRMYSVKKQLESTQEG